MESEGEILVEQIADDTAKEIVGCRRYPIAEVEDIVEDKHNGCANNRVDYTYHDELHESLVCKQPYFTFQ
jgi:hypothetical protein